MPSGRRATLQTIRSAANVRGLVRPEIGVSIWYPRGMGNKKGERGGPNLKRPSLDGLFFYEPSGRGLGGRGQPLSRFDRTAAFNELNCQFVYFPDPLVYPVNVTACCCSLARRQQALAAPAERKIAPRSWLRPCALYATAVASLSWFCRRIVNQPLANWSIRILQRLRRWTFARQKRKAAYFVQQQPHIPV